ncbi:MAG: ABC transporter ATP-binding protein [Sulfolobales archaeon]
MKKLIVENLTKRFGDLIAVNKVSFDVNEGEFFSLLGPSGCGKTTSLRCIAGLEIPDEGRIIIKDKDVTNLPPQERGVSLVFQEFAVFPHMTVYENIAFGLKVRKIPKEEIRRRVLEIAEILNLKESLNKVAGKLGLSEKQRIAIGRSVIIEPEILLLDEPLTLVDAKVKEAMRRELRRLQKDLKITILYVTHDQLEAMMMSDRIAVMNAGRILQVGTPGQIYEDPRKVFVAKFIGSPTINLLESRIIVEDGECLILIKDKEVKIRLEKKISDELIARYAGRTILLGVRPEDVGISKQPMQGYNINTRIQFVEVIGDKMEVYLRLNEEFIRALTPLRADLNEGDTIYIRLPSDKMFLFDPESEERIL